MVKATKTKQDCFGVTPRSAVVWRHIWEKIGGLLVSSFSTLSTYLDHKVMSLEFLFSLLNLELTHLSQSGFLNEIRMPKSQATAKSNVLNPTCKNPTCDPLYSTLYVFYFYLMQC